MVNGYELRLNGIIGSDNKSGFIRYICDNKESSIEYLPTNNPGFYIGDKVEFSLKSGNKYATNINLIERHRFHGWIAIIREGKGFIEQNTFNDKIEPIAFNNDNLQVDLGDEVEFNLKYISGQLTAENIVKVPLTIQNSYVIYIFNIFLFPNKFSFSYLVSITDNIPWSCCITCSDVN